ncbi:metal-binding protein ZinT [Thioclava sp. GXIMD4215]
MTLFRLALTGIFALGLAHTAAAESHMHTHASDDIYHGYFEDSQIADRNLSDWDGSWQSVYPYLKDGTLDPVIAHKAESGDKSAAEYRAYYDTGYKTDVEQIDIKGDTVTFHTGTSSYSGTYRADGHETLTYAKGNRGVRFIFKKAAGDMQAPDYIQFSDHAIAPQNAVHFHLFWGNDRASVLKELTNWPTYYPTALSGAQIVQDMLAH